MCLSLLGSSAHNTPHIIGFVNITIGPVLKLGSPQSEPHTHTNKPKHTCRLCVQSVCVFVVHSGKHLKKTNYCTLDNSRRRTRALTRLHFCFCVCVFFCSLSVVETCVHLPVWRAACVCYLCSRSVLCSVHTHTRSFIAGYYTTYGRVCVCVRAKAKCISSVEPRTYDHGPPEYIIISQWYTCSG